MDSYELTCGPVRLECMVEVDPDRHIPGQILMHCCVRAESQNNCILCNWMGIRIRNLYLMNNYLHRGQHYESFVRTEKYLFSELATFWNWMKIKLENCWKWNWKWFYFLYSIESDLTTPNVKCQWELKFRQVFHLAENKTFVETSRVTANQLW